jgi:hypothetical protein
MNCVYVKNEDGEYHGGFPMYSSCEENKYLGGNHEMLVSRYNNMVVPFGLYYRPSHNDPIYDNEHYDENQWNHQINREHDNENYYEDETMRETQCINPELFDKLLDAVRRQLSKKRKHTKNNTKKHKK